MESLNISNGIITYKVNGDAEISFNPADAGFLVRLKGAMDMLQQISDMYAKKIESLAEDDYAAMFEIATKKDKEQREIVNTVFGTDVCTPVFKLMYIDSPSQDGLPLWAELILAVLDKCGETNIEALNKRGNAKLDKYLKKYKSKQKKK